MERRRLLALIAGVTLIGTSAAALWNHAVQPPLPPMPPPNLQPTPELRPALRSTPKRRSIYPSLTAPERRPHWLGKWAKRAWS